MLSFNFEEMSVLALPVSAGCDGSGGTGSGCDCDGQEGDG